MAVKQQFKCIQFNSHHIMCWLKIHPHYFVFVSIYAHLYRPIYFCWNHWRNYLIFVYIVQILWTNGKVASFDDFLKKEQFLLYWLCILSNYIFCYSYATKLDIKEPDSWSIEVGTLMENRFAFDYIFTHSFNLLSS